MKVAVICGGVGAARLLRGLIEVVAPHDLTAIVNVGDDMELHGLNISPDLDTITYTLAGAVSTDRGWGLEGETWQAMEMLGRYGASAGEKLDWFSLGDRDLGTHLFRTQALSRGATLTEVTAQIAATWGLGFQMLPVSNDPIRTMLTIVDPATGADREISFQEYFVGYQHDVAVKAVRFVGADAALPAPGVIEALAKADRIVVAPSNPAISIDPVLAVSGVRQVLADRRDDVVAVSPIVGGKAIKGPSDRLMVELGHEASALGVARWYCELAGTLIVDDADAELAAAIEALGMNVIVTDTIMSDPEVTRALAEIVLS